jgi:hypothetical protein
MAPRTAFQQERRRERERREGSTLRVPSGLLDYLTQGAICAENKTIMEKIIQKGLVEQNAILESKPDQPAA